MASMIFVYQFAAIQQRQDPPENFYGGSNFSGWAVALPPLEATAALPQGSRPWRLAHLLEARLAVVRAAPPATD